MSGLEAEGSVITPNQFRGSDADRINQALRAAAGTGAQVVIPRRNRAADGDRDVWLLDSAILVPGGTTLVLDHCRVKLSDRCRDNLIRSANCGLGIAPVEPIRDVHIRGVGNATLEGADRPRATGDSGKTLGRRTFGTDAGVPGESQTGDWRNIGILLASVEGFSIRDLTLADTHCWAVSLERCAHGTLSGLSFSSTETKLIDGAPRTLLNQDGVDLRLGCHDILIENIAGHTGDDLVALTAIPAADSAPGRTGSTMVSDCRDRGGGLDDIRNVIVRNVRGYCAGGHHIVRLLNTPGLRLHDILIDGVLDTSPPGLRCKAAVKIGDSAYGAGSAPVGDTSRIVVTNVLSRAVHAVLIGGTLSDSILSNIVHQGPPELAVTAALGPDSLRNVTIGTVRAVGP